MISEDKVKLMTSIAILEKREGKHCFSINRYFRSDYISKHMIRAFVIYTIAVCFCLLLWLICNVEAVMGSVQLRRAHRTGKDVGILLYSGPGPLSVCGLLGLLPQIRVRFQETQGLRGQA